MVERIDIWSARSDATRRGQLILQVIDELSRSPRLASRRSLTRSVVYTSRHQNNRELRTDLNKLTGPNSSEYLYSFLPEDPVGTWAFLFHDEEFIRNCYSYVEEKRAIGAYVLQNLLDRRSFVYFDNGSTLFHLAFLMSMEGGLPRDLTIITNNSAILPLLTGEDKNVRIISGIMSPFRSYIEPSEYDIGYETRGENKIQSAFLSGFGISSRGLFAHQNLADFKHGVVTTAEQSVVLMFDHSKIGKEVERCFFQWGELGEIKAEVILVIDDRLNDLSAREIEECHTEIEKIKNLGIRVEYAPVRI